MKSRTGKRKQIYYDDTFDESGWSPQALKRLLELSSRLPYEESSHLANMFGLTISGSSLEILTSPYAQSCQKTVSKSLQSPQADESQADEPQAEGRVMVLQVDGVYALGRPQGGKCPGLEIKSAVLYPQSNPGERWMIAERCEAEDLLPMLAGLLEVAKVRSRDTLIGLGDGAKWIDNALYHLAARRITDVFHACEYLDVVMSALAWDEATKVRHRHSWYRGEVNAREWLEEHLPEPEVWLSWDETARKALCYLETRLDSMDYALYKKKGYPIGSGQVEGMNKSVIGHRMKRSGMHWSEAGARNMAALRAQVCAKHSLVDFDKLRFEAFALA